MRIMPSKKKLAINNLKESYKGTVLAVIGVSFIAIAITAFIFFTRDSRGIYLTLEVEGPVKIGEPFDIAVILNNQSSEEISNINASMILPAGVIFTDRHKALRQTVEIQNISAETFKRQVFAVVITEFAENKIFQAEAEYFSALLGRRVKDSAELSVSVGKWLDLSIKAPDEVTSGEEFEWNITYINNADTSLDMNLEIQIPQELKTDLPQARIRMAGKESQTETFTGSVVMEEGKRFTIKAIARGMIGEQEYILGETSAEILIASSPLSLVISSNKESGAPLSLNEELTYNLSFSNNSNIAMQNILVTADLQGIMFDMATIDSQGEVDSLKGEVLWNQSNTPALASLAPGATYNVNFSVKIKESYPIRRLNDKNFTVNVNANISSPTILPGVKADRTANVASITQNIEGKLRVSARAFYRDAVNRVLNEGVFPPIADEPTEYSIHWEVANYSTDMSDIQVYADLPFGVEFVEQVRVDVGELLFDSTRRRVSWQIPKILATTGVLNRPIIAIFQIRATPSLEHIEYYMPLLEPTHIRAVDDFTKTNFSAVHRYLTTELQDDKTVKPQEGIVRSP